MTSQSNETPLKLSNGSLKLSVCVVTYNQEKYIRRCLESILNQDTNFAFEVLIGDDCSSDATSAIVDEFSKAYPERVTVIKRERNVGALINYKSVHSHAKGEYVAHVDGDDYCFPSKFQKQVDFLEANADCHLVAHRMRVGNDEAYWAETKENPNKFDLDYLLKNHPCFLNSSMIYRRALAGSLFSDGGLFIDFFVYVHFGIRGRLGFVNETLGYYRTGIGISSKRDLMPYIQMAIDLAATHIGENSQVRRCRAKHYLSYAVADLMAGDSKKFLMNLDIARKNDGDWPFLKAFSCLRFFPWLARFVIGVYKKKKRKYVPIS